VRGELRTELAAVAGVVRPLLGPDLLREAEPYLAGQISEPPEDGPLRFIHYDVCPDHLIVDADTGRLNGLIDFTDAMVGDPVHDFVGLIGLGGYRFINRVAAGYDLPLRRRIRRQARMAVPSPHPDLARRCRSQRPGQHRQAPVVGGPRLQPLRPTPAPG